MPWHKALKACIHTLGFETPSIVESKLKAYIEVLIKWGKVHNLTAEKSEADICNNLIIPSLALGPHIHNFSRILDLGSGAGIPGFVLAVAYPNQQWILMEKVIKKAQFMEHAAYQLSCKNIEIKKKEFTQVAVDIKCNAVVSRGSAKLRQQLLLTRLWREQGIPLLSIQTPESLLAYQEKAVREKECVKMFIQESDHDYLSKLGLILVTVI